jgi:hypothetical protein
VLRTLMVVGIATAVLGAATWLAYTKLKEQIMATKDEILTQIADVKTVLVETGKDVGRVADKLDQAVANGNLTEVAAAVAELKSIAQGIDDRAETSDPEQTAPAEPANPDEPAPVDGTQV